MQLSVVILNYNVRYFLQLCLSSVQKAIQNIDAEIIVVDNLSPDDSCQMVREHFPEVKLIENKENFGFPKGNNIGVQQASGKYICILNPDTVVAEDTFIKLIQFANNQQELGVIGCKLIDGSGKFLPESKRGIPTPFTAFAKIFSLYKFFPKNKKFGQYYASQIAENQTAKVDVLVGAFMFLEKETYEKIGGFDEQYFMYGEDIDLSYSVLKIKKNNFYFPETTVIHYKGESTARNKKYLRHFQEGMNLFYQKHFQPSVFFKTFMKVGSFAFSLLKTVEGNQNHNKNVSQYILLSENQQLQKKIAITLKKNVTLATFGTEKDLISQTFSRDMPTEIIFDESHLSFKQMITLMEQWRHLNVSFKIALSGQNFIIGSNHSESKGNIIKFYK
ncbi:glycosyltransferase [Flavobacterium sp. NST-5]|uniref:Glycosyltransferase n=1 Tax=Flavobacterium ichthyis TaxID=2698827 RepID=A0ABW9ZAG0_9FLAO|nr:glycosyltransferase family 2 protein [Flavobacterium ichthyis]NBL65882.1 glycosyltransferase [Flavobacterium ichthyis]